MKINKKDCVVETMRGTGPGGQHRNKTDSAVRITHVPTGITAYCDERSQKTSLRKAWQELKTPRQTRKEGRSERTKRHDHRID